MEDVAAFVASRRPARDRDTLAVWEKRKVRMRRLPPERTLAALSASGQVTKMGLHALAKRLAHFHNTAATTDAARCGAPDTVWR